jgi:hypothetical protein
MENEKVEFVKFGTKRYDSHLYALDDTGTVWVRVDNDEWESLEDTPRRIKQGLIAGQLMQVMALNNRRAISS